KVHVRPMDADHVSDRLGPDGHRFTAVHRDLLHSARRRLDVIDLLAVRRPGDPQAPGEDLVQLAAIRPDQPDAEGESVVALAGYEGNPPSVRRPDGDADCDGGVVFEGD